MKQTSNLHDNLCSRVLKVSVVVLPGYCDTIEGVVTNPDLRLEVTRDLVALADAATGIAVRDP
jgi:hypothetical protein